MPWVQAVLALVKALPWFQKKFDELLMVYAEWRIQSHDKEFALALALLISKGDQTKLEEAIGSDNAGKPAIRRDGVHERPRTNSDSTTP